tara:strand:+ start:593 stop:1303 length:711 start_codon:yes stop_codon:yes gene_type:complete
MASNRDPQKDYRINRRGRKVTTSANRSKRSKKASAPKPTSSTTRSRGSGTGSRRTTSDSSRSSSGTAKVTGGKVTTPKKSFAIGGDTGRRGGTNQPDKKGPPTQGRPKIATVGDQLKKASKSPVVKAGKVAAALRSGPAALVGTIVSEAFTAAKATASQGKTSRDNLGAAYKAQQKKLPKVNAPDGPKQKKSKPAPKKKASLSAGAKSFDKAFAAARKSGKSTFTWNGKKYNTKIK